MTQDEIIQMAREAGAIQVDGKIAFYEDDLERFAALVAAHERERQAEISAIPIIIETAVKESVLAEREACAKVCDDVLGENNVSAAIRARGEK